jgi:hypothetical protein
MRAPLSGVSLLSNTSPPLFCSTSAIAAYRRREWFASKGIHICTDFTWSETFASGTSVITDVQPRLARRWSGSLPERADERDDDERCERDQQIHEDSADPRHPRVS